jgi:Ca-activated chloride channel family protein
MNDPTPPQESTAAPEDTQAPLPQEPPAAPPPIAPNFFHPGPYRNPPGEPAAPPTSKPRFPLRLVILAAAVVIGASGVGLHYVLKPAQPKQARTLGARLDLAAGDVIVSDMDGRALSGTPLATGATITTKKGARALVRTGDGAAVFLRSETTLKLLEHGVDLVSGEIWVDAPRTGNDAFTVKSGTSTVSASDAGIDVKREDKNIAVYVARGLAVMSSAGGRVEIGAGEQGKATADGKPEVASVKFWNDWTGGMVDQRGAGRYIGSGTGRLYGLDPAAPPGSPARKLGISKQVVKAVVRDGIAETEVDQSFSNPGGTVIEGYYWFTIPAAATVTGFALETNGRLVEGEVIEKREAAARYEAAVRQANDPALLEWVDGRTYRARIFPIPASGSRRVVLRYVEMLPVVEGKTRYVYPLRSDDPVRFDEFALSVDVGAPSLKGVDPEQEIDLATSLDARVEAGGRTVSMRRSGYVPRADFQLEIGAKKKRPPVAAWRFQAGPDQADYVMFRWAPWGADRPLPERTGADVVVVVDTSAGGDESSRQLRVAAAESTLRALSDGDRFAVVALDVAPRVIYPKDDLAPATEAEIGNALGKLADHSTGGATDIGAMFEPALARLHGKDQAAVVYVGDGAPTSGETGAEALIERLRRSLTGSRARFFALGTGPASSHELLAELTRAGGGQYVRIDEASQATSEALRLASAIKTPAITDVAIDLGAGLDQPLYSATGKLSRGEELLLLARTHHPLPDKVTVRGRLGAKDFEERLDLHVDTSSVTASQVPRLWAAEYARRLMGSASGTENNRAQILQLGAEYGLITPYTSSLALEDEAAYARQGITRRRSRVRGVRLTSIERPGDDERLMENLLPGAPAVAMGCSRSEKASASSNDSEDRATDGVPAQRAQNGGGLAANAPPPVPEATSEADQNGRSAGLAASAAPLEAPAPVTKTSTVATAAPTPAPAARPHAFGAVVATTPAASKNEDARRSSMRDESKAQAHRPAVLRALSLCSDIASRPLPERALLWHKRARKVTSGAELAAIYDRAFAACELPDWRDEAALLDVLGQRIETEQTAETFLAHLAPWPEAQRFVARNLLRRTVDVRIAAAISRVMHGGVDWARVDNELGSTDKSEKQLLIIKAAMLAAPNDPRGDVRYVRVLSHAGQRNEALAHGRRLRDRGFMTPTLAQNLGDVLAEAGETDEALRTYSEIVEFDGQSRDARRLLGDIYLRQGWHAAAYRQYKTLTDLDSKNPLAWLRLANAAAGAGRVDEALHIEREVAGGEGTPGPNDPRVFARLLSASRLATLLASPDPAAGVTPEAIGRKLKELSLFSGPGSLALLGWDDLDAKLVLGAADEKKEMLAGEATDAGVVGLYSVLGATDATSAVRYRGDILQRPVRFRVLVLGWDGTKFQVTVKDGKLEPGMKQRAL